MRRIYQLEIEGRPALGFDTGLNARSFANARAARYLTEPGFVVCPDGGVQKWQASGVIERETMVVWGPAFAGERLDVIIGNGGRRDEAIAALCQWIEAHLCIASQLEAAAQLGAAAQLEAAAANAALAPCAALLAENGALLFCPQGLAKRCVEAEGAESWLEGGERYIHPDRTGLAGAAFTAQAMLYHILAGAAPFTATNLETLRQDMREGNFPPLRFSAPGLDTALAALVEQRLGGRLDGEAAAGELLAVLKPEPAGAVSAASLFHPLPETERLRLAAEKEHYLKRTKAAVNTRRFVIRNSAIIAGCAAAVAVVLLAAFSIVKSRAALPTTAGMNPREVIETYYDSFGTLDHQLMEACVVRGAGKNDINMTANYFVINRVRQAYEANAPPLLVSARQWQEAGGGPVDSQVFGVTGLALEPLTGEDSGAVRYRAAYILWIPGQENPETAGTARLPQGYRHTDTITLERKKDKWRISKIERSVAGGG